MSTSKRLCKQPRESRKFTMDFYNVLSAGTIDGVVSVDHEKLDGSASDLTIHTTGIENGLATDSRVSMIIGSGTSGQAYRIEVLINSSNGETIEGDGILFVTDNK